MLQIADCSTFKLAWITAILVLEYVLGRARPVGAGSTLQLLAVMVGSVLKFLFKPKKKD